jgi:AraC-like DNA-binding protein
MLRNLNVDNRRLDNQTNKNTQFIIDEAFLNENATITLTLLSKRLNMSSRELERFLKIHYNKTFNQMKTEARMFAASGLLVYSDKSINEISIIAGYTSPEHFCYAFKKFYKHTPNEYRKLRRSLRNREPGTF